MKITGIIHQIGETQTVSARFTKRELIIDITNNPTYPEFRKIEFQQDKTSLLDPLRIGQKVEVDFWAVGRKWVAPDGIEKYFNTDKGSAITVLESVTQQIYAPPAAQDTPEPVAEVQNDDLPF